MTRTVTAGTVGLLPACRSSHRNDWPVTGGAPTNDRYSTLDQINRTNVSRLTVAWTYHTGDMPAGRRSEIQATPIVIDSVLYTTTPALAVIALRAEPRHASLALRSVCWPDSRASRANRGVVYWADGDDRRILSFTASQRLYALDARTGRPIRTFGDSGSVDLGAGLGRDVPVDAGESPSAGVRHRDQPGRRVRGPAHRGNSRR